jgi:hypothetical protein
VGLTNQLVLANKHYQSQQRFATFSNKLISNPPVSFTDAVITIRLKQKMISLCLLKTRCFKSHYFKNEGESTSLDDLEKTAKNLDATTSDTTKYYRLKADFVGSRDTISFLVKTSITKNY